MVSGIAFYPFHLFLPMIVVFITGIPLILKSKGVYITLDGIGMENPDFSDALLVIDTMLFQIMLLQPFIALVYSRGVDLKIQDVRLILGTPLRRRILSSLFAFVIAGSSILRSRIFWMLQIAFLPIFYWFDFWWKFEKEKGDFLPYGED